jgi:predicted Zn-dependent protease
MRNAPPADVAIKALAAPRAREWLRPVLLGVMALLIVASAWVARRLWQGSPEGPEDLLPRAHAAWSSGRLDEAEALLAALARLGRPRSVPERLLRAQTARERGRIDDALAALDGVPESGPDAALIWRSRGLLQFERNRAVPAEAALLESLKHDPKMAEARRGLIDLYAIQGRRGELGAQFRALARQGALTFDDLYLWCLGRRLDVGPAELAAKQEAMLRNEPGDRVTRLALVESHRRLGRLAEAEAGLAPLPAADPEARAARARVAIDRGAVDEAARILSEGPADHPALEKLRGRLALGRGERSAVDHFRAALAADPEDRDTLFGLGQGLRLSGQASAARPYLEAARARDHLEWLVQNARSSFERDDPKALSALGDACRSLGRLHEAHGWYRLALDRDPLAAQLQKNLFELDATLARDRK